MRKRTLVTVVALALVALAVIAIAGCGTSTVQSDAQQQIASAKAALESAKAQGVQIPASEQKKLSDAETALKKDSVNALILAVEARADIQNDIQDAFNNAKSTYNTAVGGANTAISRAPAGTNLAQAKQSLANADAKSKSAKTIADWYNPTDGPIYWANLAAAQATTAALAQAGAQATAQELQRVQQGSTQMLSQMNQYLVSKGANPSDYKVGIQKISSDATWATGAATPIVSAPGSTVISFLFHYENGSWVLKAAPSWTKGQFGAPTDMVP